MNIPNLYFLSFELSVYLLFALAFWHAFCRSKAQVWELLSGALFGLLLGSAVASYADAGHFGRFLIMFGNLPLLTGAALGTLLYSVRLLSDASSLPQWARPLLDGLAVLNVAVAMEVAAVRLGFWDWGQNLNSQYAGVPYAVLWGWFWLALSFSAGYRLAKFYLPERRRVLLAPLGAVGLGAAGFWLSSAFLAYVVPAGWHLLVVGGGFGAAVVLVLSLRPILYVRPVDSLVFWTPFGFHTYFLLAGLISGALLWPPVLLLVNALMALTAYRLHRSTFQTWDYSLDLIQQLVERRKRRQVHG